MNVKNCLINSISINKDSDSKQDKVQIMTWICPKCGNENKDEFDRCICCYLDKKWEAIGTGPLFK